MSWSVNSRLRHGCHNGRYLNGIPMNHSLPIIGLLTALVGMAGAAGAQAATVARPQARVVGTIYDSLAMKPLPGALVQLMLLSDPAQTRSVTSADDGAFRFDSVAAGDYVVGFLHPRLDSIPVTPAMVRVEVRDGIDATAALRVPSSRSVIAGSCGTNALSDSTGLFAGTVRSASGAPLTEPGKVRVGWTQFIVSANGMQRSTPSVITTTTPEGKFAVCGIPLGASVLVRAFAGADSSGFAELPLAENGVLHRMLYVSRAERIASTDSTRPSETMLRGPGTLGGVVRDARNQPVAGVRATVWSTGVEAVTNARGEFQLSGLPSGTYTLEVRGIGYEPVRRPVDIVPDREETVAVSIVQIAKLSTVKVNATRVYTSTFQNEAEARRRALGFGYFIDETAIEKRNPIFVSDLLRTTPGVFVSLGARGERVTMRGAGRSAYCTPAIFIDGALANIDDGRLDTIVSAQEVRSVEVYPHASSVPGQFLTLNGCGSIVLWTGPRRPIGG
ncbi:MAG TPA: carboxypeptidase regulatory-like domain-containing protein [Gemmatimonas sp.]|nr:carboxypeptidase regulatory-like domain-containing protein [Gemmatimonas sp.]